MTTEKTIYIVTSGHHSDYGIEAVFSTRDAAQAFVDAREKDAEPHYGDASIEEWPLDVTPEGFWHIEVTMLKNGDTVIVRDPEFGIESPRSYFNTVRPDTPHHYLRRFGLKDNDVAFITNVQTRDAGRAVKVANERRTQHLAYGTWGVNP